MTLVKSSLTICVLIRVYFKFHTFLCNGQNFHFRGTIDDPRVHRVIQSFEGMIIWKICIPQLGLTETKSTNKGHDNTWEEISLTNYLIVKENWKLLKVPRSPHKYRNSRLVTHNFASCLYECVLFTVSLTQLDTSTFFLCVFFYYVFTYDLHLAIKVKKSKFILMKYQLKLRWFNNVP